MEYIPITSSDKKGRVILKGYIIRKTYEERVMIEPITFDSYQDMVKYIRRVENEQERIGIEKIGKSKKTG